ncbi:DUF11 domain-containing protein [Tahibacter soli]|uniref:DUF11 domain-containing protein n=1 Tax=Tahibacter soli TaxID=2983605 RepID=A0A9X3YRY4_9GAMM|nr:DUF11 domain-containing protein [Tahibacter soli]MDC8015908.1 DUF11 domain-containing protein [Tahibacter soli]
MDNFQGAPRRPAWVRGAFAASLVAAGLLALSPDWASALKAQGYYGSVDLGVTLTPSQTPRAGEAVDFLVTVRNDGPDAANRVRTIAGAQNLHVLETNGCAADPLGYPQCALPSPLAAGASGDYLLRMKVPPGARGNMVLSVSATSDDDEIAPGDEVALFKAPIATSVDLRTSTRCSSAAFPSPTSRIFCDFEIDNAGPATALSPIVSFFVSYPGNAYWSCVAPRPGQCPAGTQFSTSYAFTPTSIETGDVLRVRAEILPPPVGYPVVNLSGNTYSIEQEANYIDNTVNAWFDTTLFRDDFEPISPSSNP